MSSGEHVHIISAGENIHTAYPTLFRTLPGITRTYVLADSPVYELSSDPEIEKGRLATRNAVTAVKELSATLSIPFSRELVFPPVYPSARDLLERIVQENPGAHFTMDLSAGSRSLCTALATMAPWLEAEVYSSFDEKVPRAVPALGIPVKAMLANPNYQTILALLLRKYAKHVPDGTREWLPREYLYKQVWSVYRRTRARNGKPDTKPVAYRHRITSPQELAHGTFSTFMKALIAAGLVEERMSSGEKIRKEYRSTETGEMAFRFYANADTSSLVRTILGKKKGFQLISERSNHA